MKYKFKLIESLENEDTILEDIQEDRKEKEAILDEVRDIMSNEDFTESKELNGISFVKEIKGDEFTIKAQLYVDTTTYEYSTYVQSTAENNDSNFSSKGTHNSLVSAANRLVFEISGI